MELQNTINTITQKGKGILAADESTPTCTKRFESIGVESTADKRRDYREALFTTPQVNEFVSGVILFEETLMQQSKEGTPLSEILSEQGILPGIKVDKGLKDIEGTDGEKVTQGHEGLGDRLQEYKKHGARFAKWRAVYTVSASLPSQTAIDANAKGLARYAKTCQDNGFVPIVEPEVLINGDHSLERCREVTTAVLKKVFEELSNHDVELKHIILKPSMVISGIDASDRANVGEVAGATVDVLKECVPSEVPTINFLSGGQTPEEATAHLQAMNDIGGPWMLSFSYGRALQEPALSAWAGKDENVESAQQAFYKRAKLNSAAVLGMYTEAMESE